MKVSESAYPQHADNPVQMTHLLDLYKTNDVLQIETKNFTVNSGSATVGNIIEIPEVTTTEPVVLDIQAGGITGGQQVGRLSVLDMDESTLVGTKPYGTVAGTQ